MKKITILIVVLFAQWNIHAQHALDFNPDNGIQQVFIEDITCPEEFTFEAWIFFRGPTGTYNTIFEFGNDAPWIGLFGSTDAKLRIFPVVLDPDPMPINQWVHVAASYSTATLTAKVYVNGQLKATEESVTVETSGIGAGIGYNNGDSVFNGAIDEIRLWEVVRTDSEIAANWNSCIEENESGLYAYYKFNDGPGSTELDDLTENDFDGELIDMDPSTDWIEREYCNTLAVNDFETIQEISVSPNPTSDYLIVSGIEAMETFQIYGILGQRILKGTISPNERLDLNELKSGVYFLSLENGPTVKFIKR